MKCSASRTADGGSAVAGWLSVQAIIDATEADVRAAVTEDDEAHEALEACIRGRVGWDAAWATHTTQVENADARLRFAFEERIGRIVGAYLLAHGHGLLWAALYPVLVAAVDVGDLGIADYAYGAEVRFVEAAGRAAHEAEAATGAD